MNGPAAMYVVKPIIRHELPVELPNCMYGMKNLSTEDDGDTIHFSSGDHVSSNGFNVPEQKLEIHPEMSHLLQRQEKILRDLAELKQQMLGLKTTLAVTDLPTTTKCPADSSEIAKVIDLVINVSPLHPPYSLLIMKKLWRNFVKFQFDSYTHSTVTSLPSGVQNFVKEIQQRDECNTSVPLVNVKLIWKDVDEKMELIASPSASVAICGETNILRYLCRIGPDGLNYEAYENPTEIDSMLDVCYLLSRARTKTERHTYLTYLSGKLGKSNWFFGRREMSIADIAASSVIKQVCANECNQTMTKWLQRCKA